MAFSGGRHRARESGVEHSKPLSGDELGALRGKRKLRQKDKVGHPPECVNNGKDDSVPLVK